MLLIPQPCWISRTVGSCCRASVNPATKSRMVRYCLEIIATLTHRRVA